MVAKRVDYFGNRDACQHLSPRGLAVGNPPGACEGSNRNGRPYRRCELVSAARAGSTFSLRGNADVPWACAGFPILLDLLSAAKTDACDATGCVFSRKATARAYGVSRAHVTAILARAERLNILKRNGSRIVLSDLALQNVRRDLAYQLAFVVLWAEAVRPSPPSADAPESLSGWNGSSNPR